MRFSRLVQKIVFIIILALMTLLAPFSSYAENFLYSPINKRPLNLGEKTEKYSFLLIGHLYGSPHNMRSVFPSPSLLANIKMINSSGAKFLISLGDTYRKPSDINIFKDIAAKIKIPIFNTVGNHDVINRLQYQENFGKTFYDFVYQNSLFIFLDTEVNGNTRFPDQIAFLNNTLKSYENSNQIQNVFLLTHKLYWTLGNPRYQVIYNRLRIIKDPYVMEQQTVDKIHQALLSASKGKSIYWISGDITTVEMPPIFYDKDTRNGVTYLATGLGDTKEDMIVQVEISNSGDAVITPLSLTRKKVYPIESYGLDLWKKHLSRFINRPLVTYILSTVRHRCFYTAVSLGILSIIVFFSLFFLFRKKIC